MSKETVNRLIEMLRDQGKYNTREYLDLVNYRLTLPA